ncbi:AEC family transporter [Anaerocolumna sp. MB42-C2]|uniref:AEC family transporter n=1 Tax=Anaerocolumna sp. MB42-C2 TaxID=3070997 RepID=UPI0027E1A6A7|nr:AEC family transporter [Anaerocolumna sp. MB42-C2]WMJ89065.1 AEC family transporter [Anaerocolumna sp. MB42-C2]
MLSMLNMQGTLFLLILAGIYAQKKGIITCHNRKKMTDLIIEIILPCNIVNSFLIDWSYSILINCITVLAAAIITQVIYVIVSRMLFRKSSKDKQAVLRYAIICSNAGFLGNPIVESVFGSQGLLFASVALIPLRFAMWSSGLKLFTDTDGKSTAKKLMTHPCIIAVFIGFILMFTQIKLPGFMLKTLSGIGNCNTAISMIVIGSILAEIHVKEILDKELFYYSAIRLIIIPAVILIILKLFAVDSLVIGVIVLLSAMPAGSTTVMLADKYGGNSVFASSCVFVSTVLSLITIPFVSILLV